MIIGRNTFSAAQNTVNMMESTRNATFVGEPTGSRPNFVGESTYIVMPYSKLRVVLLVALLAARGVDGPPQMGAAADRGGTVVAGFVENRDPCLEAILGGSRLDDRSRIEGRMIGAAGVSERSEVLRPLAHARGSRCN